MAKQPKDSGIPPLPKLGELRAPPGDEIPLKEYHLAEYDWLERECRGPDSSFETRP